MWTTKKQLRKTITKLENQLGRSNYLYSEVLSELMQKNNLIEELYNKYPFEIGQLVYDVQLRNTKGRFTKKNPSLEHSYVNAIVVDKKNYFNIVDRYNNKDVFRTKDEAIAYLENTTTNKS